MAGVERLQKVSPEGRSEERYQQFEQVCKRVQGVVYSESQRILAGKRLRKPPSYIICPDDAFRSFISEKSERGQVRTGHRGEEVVPERAELVWLPYWNVIVIPERLVTMSQSSDVLLQMDANMKLGEDIIHAVTTVEDPQTHLLRTGFNTNIGHAEETGLESGAVYVANAFPDLETNKPEGIPEESPQSQGLFEKQVILTEAATMLVTNMLLAKICNVPTYPKMQFELEAPIGSWKFDIKLRENKAQLEGIFQALYAGTLDLDVFQKYSFVGTRMTPVIRNGRMIEETPTQSIVALGSVMHTLLKCRMLSIEDTGRKDLNVYNYQALRT